MTFGAAPGLGSSVFTLETWFRRDGAGIATFTGTGGITAIPLVTKGMAEVDNSDNKDMNYFLGIRQTDGVLVASIDDPVTMRKFARPVPAHCASGAALTSSGCTTLRPSSW